MANIQRNDDGTFPAYAWPGGYPLLYVTKDAGCLCPKCANRENGSEASIEVDAPSDWRIVGQDVHWEGPAEICDHCGAEIESAYGIPNETE